MSSANPLSNYSSFGQIYGKRVSMISGFEIRNEPVILVPQKFQGIGLGSLVLRNRDPGSVLIL
jgi:hypothetical protein